MEKVLEINELSKRFGSLQAVDNVTFSVEKGNVYGLLGPNGSGKSTTLGMILGIINPTSGSWKWFGQDASHEVMKKIGAIIESPKFYPYLSAKKNLEIVAEIKGVPYQNIEEKLELVGLADRKEDKFQTYSLGMKQRLAIASALLNNPEVLILDEPTNGLDPQGIIQIREIIKKIAALGTTIILASHLLDEVEKVCSHVVVLNKGKILYAGSVEEMHPSFGILELGAADLEALVRELKQMPYFSKVEKVTNFVVVRLNTALTGEQLNKQLFDRGIVLNHLVQKRESLETQFFQLIQNYNA
ncbi:ABC transporter ATP-binding protein [Vaginella massiliensis]|uniref:ABC transporter ATP-binding protein n=1 Tax=Vaginella massiliensis TaxID=1816680 RepID=UPI000837C53C|nr:ABC transporter ATP-binding protein [Vaginella massiliensis]